MNIEVNTKLKNLTERKKNSGLLATKIVMMLPICCFF